MSKNVKDKQDSPVYEWHRDALLHWVVKDQFIGRAKLILGEEVSIVCQVEKINSNGAPLDTTYISGWSSAEKWIEDTINARLS